MIEAIYAFPAHERASEFKVVEDHCVPRPGQIITVCEESYLVESVSDNTNMEGQRPIVTIYLKHAAK